MTIERIGKFINKKYLNRTMKYFYTTVHKYLDILCNLIKRLLRYSC